MNAYYPPGFGPRNIPNDECRNTSLIHVLRKMEGDPPLFSPVSNYLGLQYEDKGYLEQKAAFVNFMKNRYPFLRNVNELYIWDMTQGEFKDLQRVFKQI